MNKNIQFLTNNVAIVQAPEFSVPTLPMLTIKDYNDSFGTINLRVIKTIPVTPDEFMPVRLLFGTWVESGNEDQQLEELYKSRLNPSVSVTG